MPPTVKSAPPRTAAAALLLTACATVRVRSPARSHGPQIRARAVALTFTRVLP